MRMIKFLLIVLLISFTYTNPIFITYINEFQTAPDSLERIELHETPAFGQINLGGWTIKTNAGTATINPGTILPYNGYVTIDRTNTTGIFSLDETCDSIILYDNSSLPLDWVRWPRSPAPPYDGSSAIYRSNTYWMEINWYIDSTPTFNGLNDDWSSISGRVLNQDSQPVVYAEVYAYGPTGGCDGYSDSLGSYTVAGLGEGKYWLRAYYRYQIQGHYPESVFVSYSQHITDIDIILPFIGIEEPTKSIAIAPFFSFPNPIRGNSKISLILSKKTKAIIKVYDTQGILVRILSNGMLNAGTHQFGLNLNTNPGVYFLNYQIGEQKAITKKLTYLK